jgi:hypothetical protein
MGTRRDPELCLSRAPALTNPYGTNMTVLLHRSYVLPRWHRAFNDRGLQVVPRPADEIEPDSFLVVAGDADQRILLTDHTPTPYTQRPQDPYLLLTAVAAGWPKDEVMLVDLLSVILAESAADSRGFLAYIDLGVERHSERGLRRWQIIDQYDEEHPRATLTTYRSKIAELVPGAKVTRADCGLMQLGKTFPGWRREELNTSWTVAKLMDPKQNLKIGYDLWKRRGWQPWAAYTTPRPDADRPPAEAFKDRAEKAVKKFLRL